MTLHEASFRVKHECPYREISEHYPDLTIREWYQGECQVIEITSPDTPGEETLEQIEGLGTVLHESVDESGLHLVTQSCLCSFEDSLIERFEKHNCLYQPPTIYRLGWEHYTVIAFDETDVRELLGDLQADRDIEVLSETAISERTIPQSMVGNVDTLFEDLTDRQMAALELALESGYYEQPRKTSLRELAKRTAVARSTYEEHLRKAENKLLTNAGKYLRLVTTTAAGNPLQVEKSQRAEHVAD